VPAIHKNRAEIRELFMRIFDVRGMLLHYLAVITPLGLSGFWEILESWFARAVRPELGQAALGTQGDIWDAQKDMTAAFYGSLICLTAIVLHEAWCRRGQVTSDMLMVESDMTDPDLPSTAAN
jgi:putative membrane protein